MRLLITGLTGFVGSHLAEYALAQGAEVWGVRRAFRSSLGLVAHLGESVRWVEADLTDAYAARAALQRARPEVVVHLAAQSDVAASWLAPEATLRVNALGTLHVLEAARQLSPAPRVVIASSSEVYGLVYPDELPITEDQPLRPLSPYAVSKVAADLLGWQYQQSYGLEVIRVRTFNLSGPRRGVVFRESTWARQLAVQARGRPQTPPTVRVGNLEAVRDLTDVRDAARAYWLAAERGQPGAVYHVASGVGHSGTEVLDRYRRLLRLPQLLIEVDPARLRPSDVPRLVGDATKAALELDWKPVIGIDQTLRDLYDWWAARLAEETTP